VALNGGSECIGDTLESRIEDCDTGIPCEYCGDIETTGTCIVWKNLGYCDELNIFYDFVAPKCNETYTLFFLFWEKYKLYKLFGFFKRQSCH